MEYITMTAMLRPGIDLPGGETCGTWMPSPLVLVAFCGDTVSVYRRDTTTGDFVLRAKVS